MHLTIQPRLNTALLLLPLLFVPLGCDSAVNRQRQVAMEAERSAQQAADSQAAIRRDELAEKAADALILAGAKLERSTTNVVTSVDLRGIEVIDPHAAQLSQLPRLEKLSLDQSAMTIGGWTALGKLSGLSQLDLRDCPVDNEQLTAALGGMPKLKALRLSGKSGRTSVDDSGMIAIARCLELKALAIDDLWVSTAGIEHLSANKKLAEFYAGGTMIDEEAALTLAKLPALRKLRLSRTGIGSVALETLTALPLEDLDISEASGVDDECLASVGKMKSLKRLNLWRDTVSDDGAVHLAGLTNLEWLNLDNTHISDASLPHLSGLSKLTFLHLGSTGVTDAGMPDLVSLKSLKDLKVTRTSVTEAGVAVVQQAIPGIEVQLKYIEGE